MLTRSYIKEPESIPEPQTQSETETETEPEHEPSQTAESSAADTPKETEYEIVAPEDMEVSLCKIDDVRPTPLVHEARSVPVTAPR